MPYDFDRYLRHDELTEWLHDLAADHPSLVAVESYGRSFEGRELWLVTVTDTSTGRAEHKPAHWVDASIHAVEMTGTVAACALLAHLVDGHRAGDPVVTEALRTRTFYVVPRVNPDGVEWALAERPRFRRSSTRPWPWPDAYQWPGLRIEDVDGDGRVLQMRIEDPDGAWIPHVDDARLLVPVVPGGPSAGTPRYRLLHEGAVVDHDGFTIPTPRPPEGLDLNRNFPAGWGTGVSGSGDHPLSEPEVDALVRAIVERPNICGYNALHTSGGVLLRPSSTRADAALPPLDVWVWQQLGAIGTELTGYPVHSVFEDFTWDKAVTMSGAADDWAYEHLGIYAWTTELWDVVHAATGEKQATDLWYVGPSDAQALAVLRWVDEHAPEEFVDWYTFEHPVLGTVELGGWHYMGVWTNPPPPMLRAEVAGHAPFAVRQALASPRLTVRQVRTVQLAAETWRVEVGVANSGWLPTHVSSRAAKESLVEPVIAEVRELDPGVSVVGGPQRLRLGQLSGHGAMRFASGHDGTPDRVLARWIVQGAEGAELTVSVTHQRAGTVAIRIALRADDAGPVGDDRAGPS
ncbi:MAG: M14 family metallopeptidase [Ilumatobacteraceae bacterium]